MSTQSTKPKRGRGRPPLYRAPRTQYTVRVESHENSALETLAAREGYPTVNAFLTDMARKRAHEELAATQSASEPTSEEERPPTDT